MDEREAAQMALYISHGACNPLAITNTMLNRMRTMVHEEGEGFDAVRKDPALRLMAHQLAYLFLTETLHNNGSYKELIKHCQELVDPSLTI